MSLNTLPPIDQRISAWVELERQANKGPKEKYDVSITLSREFGCEGYPLALKLKEDLEAKWGGEWTIFDQLLIDKILAERKISAKLLESIGERSKFLDTLISSLNPRWKTDQDLYEIMVETIHSLAQKGRCIFVGRGAAVVTQDLENCFHFRLEAPLEFRKASLVQRLSLAPSEADALIKAQENQREDFINHFLGVDLSEMQYYHLKFNNAKIHKDEVSKMMLQTIENFLS